jgi:protein TonB
MIAAIRPFRRHVPMLSLLALLSACGEAPEPAAVADALGPALMPESVASPEMPEMTPAELMRRANAAFRENRIIDASRDNATELFLAVRERAPKHPGLAEALVEIMPLAQFAIDAAVRNADLTEAERLHALIARIDPDSSITQGAGNRVAELRARLADSGIDAERPVPVAAAMRPPERERLHLPESATAANTPPEHAIVTEDPPQPATAVAARSDDVQVQAVSLQPVSARTASSMATTLTAPKPVSKIAPEYPPQARHRKVDGFVELEFRVTTNGSTEDIRVVRSEPEGLFDRNAVRALMRWKFKPAERNGVPEAATTRTTMNFRQS